MPSSTNTNVGRSFSGSKLLNTPSAKGSIIAAVAVLEIHIDSSAVTTHSITTARPMWPPAKPTSHVAIFWSIFWMCRAVAKAKPPKNRKMIGSENPDIAFSMLIATISPVLGSFMGMPMSIAKTGTSKAVTVMCTASVSHSTATNVNSAMPLLMITPWGVESLYGNSQYTANAAATAVATKTQPLLVDLPNTP